MRNYAMNEDGSLRQLGPNEAADWSINGRQIAETWVGSVRVSTVFLPLDHSHLPDGQPICFETIAFGTGSYDFEERYHTIQEAKAGHEHAVRNVLLTDLNIEGQEADDWIKNYTTFFGGRSWAGS